MAFLYQPNGNLPPGIYEISIEELKTHFGFSKHRRFLIEGLLEAIKALKACGCSTIYIDGSFASNCDHPNDYDACYDPAGMDFGKLSKQYPVFLEFANRRQSQKHKYRGEFFSATAIASPPKTLYLEFFQKDKNDDSPKGILKLNLKAIP